MNTKGFRAPAVPLITHDPMFSLWSFADKLTDDTTRHWTGVRQAMFGFVAVDGVIYEFLGRIHCLGERYATSYRKLPQTGCEVRPMTTVYTFENDLLTLELTFTSPLLLNDLMLLSRPVSYIDYKLCFKDGKPHDAHVHFGFTGEFCVNETTQQVSVGLTPYSIYLTSGTENMLVQAGDDHRIEWGSLHAIAPDYEMSCMSLRSFWRQLGLLYGDKNRPLNPMPCQGPNAETKGPEEYALYEKTPVHPHYPTILLCKKFAAVTQISDGIAVGYEDIKSIQYFGENIEAYWRKDGDDFSMMVRKALDEHDQVLAKVAAFEEDLLAKANAISAKYADLLSLAYRQTIAGHKLTWHEGKLQFFSKENYSNGCIATVDVTYPSMPLFLLYAPDLVEGMLDPVFKMIEKGMWHYAYAPHDVGTYPLANGQIYGYSFRHRSRRPDPEDSQMPVEECGNMLLCVAAVCFAKKDMQYFTDHAEILKQWADYLVNIGYDPANQLCTDDFAGHLAHNCNLSAKAICALAAYAKMLEATGNQMATTYAGHARQMAASWEAAAFDGDHYKLAFDQSGSWSLKYNMVWDKLLNLKLFSQKVYDTELLWYERQLRPYGVPLDNRGDTTKTDWELWSTALFHDTAYTNAVVDAMWRWLCDTPDRMPFPDLVYTSEPYLRGFVARTVQGGLFINLLKF